MFKVTYRIRESGVVITKEFGSPYLCRALVAKLKRSKKCELLSYPLLT